MIDSVDDTCQEISALGMRMLLSAKEWPIAVDDLARWKEFLELLDVGDGLPPRTLSTENLQLTGRSLAIPAIAERLRLSARVGQQWRGGTSMRSMAQFPETPYKLGSVCLFPGQGEIESQPLEARTVYAHLVVVALERWPDERWQLTFDSQGSRWNSGTLHSPALGFVTTANWMVVARPGQQQTPDVVDVRHGWVVGNPSADARYLPSIVSDLRRRIEQSPKAKSILRAARLPVWGEAESSPAVLEQFPYLLENGIREADVASFKKAYQEAWEDVAKAQRIATVPTLREVSVDALIVQSMGVLRARTRTDENLVFVCDGSDRIREHLADTLGFDVITLPDTPIDVVIGLLARDFGSSVRNLTTLGVTPRAAGRPFRATRNDAMLVEGDRWWLPILLACTLEYASSRFLARGDVAIREVLRRSERIQLHWSPSVDLLVDTQIRPIPPAFRPALPIEDPELPCLLVEGDETWTWRILRQIAGAIAQLVGVPGLAPEIASVAAELEVLMGGEFAEPGIADLALAFRRPVEAVRELVAGLRGSVTVLLDLLYPVAVHVLGRDAGDEVVAAIAGAADEGDGARLLSPLAHSLNMEADEFG